MLLLYICSMSASSWSLINASYLFTVVEYTPLGFFILVHESITSRETNRDSRWWAGRESNPDLQLRTLPCCSLHYPPIWNSRRESNPDLFVRTEASSCVRPREPTLMWKGCRELNSDLKVRS